LKELEDTMREADVIYTLRLPQNLAERSPKLKWVQFISAGVESVREASTLGSDVLVTNASGCHAIPIAEHVLGFMLMLAKQTRRYLASQQAKNWDRFFPEELGGKTMGIVGLGSIGREVARIAKALRMKVLATRRSTTKRESGVEGVDDIYPASELTLMFPECDYVVVSVPLTPETTKMIGERELRAMKPSAYFINIARGKVVDQPILIKALKEGWIAGAAIDVTDPEPLPPESELWDVPNLIITAHIAGGTYGTGYRAVQLFRDNLKRYLAGEKLVNIIDRARGY
jgi:phosphoglycerate dehydrogenase-like enzyme